MKNDLVIIVAKVYMVKYHLTAQLLVSHGIGILVIMLPCPESCSLFTLRDIALFILICTYQLHITVIDLRLLIQQFKDTVCSCQRHHDTV